MKLSKLLESVYDVKYSPFGDVEVTGVFDDSRECEAGSVFVAICGHRQDGHIYAMDAYNRGARVFVLSRKIDLPKDSIVICSENTRKTLAEMCASINGHPEKKLVCVGITGTKGKTTAMVFLSNILRGFGVKNIAVGTIGISEGGFDNEQKTSNTTPPPPVLFSALAKAYENGCRVACIEVSSQSLKDFRVYGIPFKFAAFTGLSCDHIGEAEHPDMDDYVRSKRLLFQTSSLKSAVVNSDDDYFLYMSSAVGRVIKCGFLNSADFRITDFSDGCDGSEFYVNGIKVKSVLPGAYNAVNITVALALAAEITKNNLSLAVGFVDGIKVKGRFERFCINDKNVIVDYAHNGNSFKEIISLSRRLFSGRVICVFGSVGRRCYGRRRELAEAAEAYADFSVITSDNSANEFSLGICADIYSYFNDKTKAKIIVKRDEAITYAVNEANVGDCVLILGRGHEDEIEICGKRIAFSDVEFVRNLKTEAESLIIG
ncbi:MAG: UDP-N-acetylmuramoyl-L-alanyl-D-glutamate--2,6-diaminopimelate ligase [Ruminococcaceae bacterium]|nr:UDP-N-acetylmuramoyl-L-alanyl-D-glutamate--2,6-diaminopimelate ligase [Oscillospiraceae bacterium]